VSRFRQFEAVTTRLFALVCAIASPLFPAYSNLVATDDGRSVYFTAPGGLFVARDLNPGVTVTSVSPDDAFMDTDGSGTLYAYGRYVYKRCTSGISSCVFAADCTGEFRITGPGLSWIGPPSTLVRFDYSGKYAWIQASNCLPHEPPPLPASHVIMYGIYDAVTRTPVALSLDRKVSLANVGYGRRAITANGRALVLRGPQLEWFDAVGEHPIRNVNGAYEAATDRAGANVVYVDAKLGRLHWIAATDRSEGLDEDLTFTGSAPAISADGTFLAFLAADGGLHVYDRASRRLRRMGSDVYSAFAVGGEAIFGVTTAGSLVRADANTGSTVPMLNPIPEISSVWAPPTQLTRCSGVCYEPDKYGSLLTGGMILLVNGNHFTQPGWRFRINDVEITPVVLTDKTAYLQVPSGTPKSANTLEYYSTALPMRATLGIRMYDSILAVCFATVHQGFDRVVSSNDPARPGEVVHTFLTGLRGVQSVPDGVPNPLDPLIPVADAPMIDATAARVLFFGLAPGLVGIQQLDMQIIQPFNTGLQVGGFGCQVPVAAR
jgi:hypothetical protein